MAFEELFQEQYKYLFDILKNSEERRKRLTRELYSKKLISQSEFDQITFDKERKSSSNEVVEDLLKIILTICKPAPENIEKVLGIMEDDALLENVVKNMRKRSQDKCEASIPSKKAKVDDTLVSESSSQLMAEIHSQGIHYH